MPIDHFKVGFPNIWDVMGDNFHQLFFIERLDNFTQIQDEEISDDHF